MHVVVNDFMCSSRFITDKYAGVMTLKDFVAPRKFDCEPKGVPERKAALT